MKSGMTGSGIRGNGRRARKRSMPLLGAAFLPQKNPFTNLTEVIARSRRLRASGPLSKHKRLAPENCPSLAERHLSFQGLGNRKTIIAHTKIVDLDLVTEDAASEKAPQSLPRAGRHAFRGDLRAITSPRLFWTVCNPGVVSDQSERTFHRLFSSPESKSCTQESVSIKPSREQQ